MFLDEKLLEMCKNSKANTPELIQQLNLDICNVCDDHWRHKLNNTTSNKQIKIYIDKTFKLFDSFLKMAKESGDVKLIVLGDLFSKYNYKDQLFSNVKIKEIYDKL